MKEPITDHRGNIVGYMEEEKPEVKPAIKKVPKLVAKPAAKKVPKPAIKKEKSDKLK